MRFVGWTGRRSVECDVVVGPAQVLREGVPLLPLLGFTRLRPPAQHQPPAHALCLREDAIAGPVDQFLHEELGERTLSTTLRRLADAQHRQAMAEHDEGAADELRGTIDDCDAKIARYRAAIDAGGGPALVAGWISETTAIRKAAEARLGLAPGKPARMTEDQIRAIVARLAGCWACSGLPSRGTAQRSTPASDSR